MRNVEFHDGLPDEDMLQKRTLIIIDDFMDQLNTSVNDIFTKYSHHRDVSVMFVTQNIFHKKGRTCSLNAHYLVLFKNPRDVSQISHLSRQMYPHRTKFLVEAFNDATKNPFTCLVLDLKSDTSDKMRIRSGVFHDEENFVYVPR